MRSELDQVICSGARKGKQFTYALLDERVPEHTQKKREEALAELTRRYFISRGPATIADFSTWSGLTLTDCKRGISMVESHFVETLVDNEVFYYSPQIPVNKEQFQDFYLLPIYDEFIMGYKDRKAIFEARNTIEPRPLFRFDNTIMVEGQIIGTWKRTIHKQSINLECEFFRPLRKRQLSSLENAIHCFEKFTKLTVSYEVKAFT